MPSLDEEVPPVDEESVESPLLEVSRPTGGSSWSGGFLGAVSVAALLLVVLAVFQGSTRPGAVSSKAEAPTEDWFDSGIASDWGGGGAERYADSAPRYDDGQDYEGSGYESGYPRGRGGFEGDYGDSYGRGSYSRGSEYGESYDGEGESGEYGDGDGAEQEDDSLRMPHLDASSKEVVDAGIDAASEKASEGGVAAADQATLAGEAAAKKAKSYGFSKKTAAKLASIAATQAGLAAGMPPAAAKTAGMLASQALTTDPTPPPEPIPARIGCRTAVAPYEADCVGDINWIKTTGINQHPDWYPGLTAQSPAGDIQSAAFKSHHTKCSVKGCTGDKVECLPNDCGCMDDAVNFYNTWISKQPAMAGTCQDGQMEVKGHCLCPPNMVPDDANGCKVAEEAVSMTFYMYRAQSDYCYAMENVNLGDLAGVMWYLHKEVVASVPRKYNVTRILRYLVTVKNPKETFEHKQYLFNGETHGKQFGPFGAFDQARCTATHCESELKEFGNAVGCQAVETGYYNYKRQAPVDYCDPPDSPECISGTWYSLIGDCPLESLYKKTEDCKQQHPDPAHFRVGVNLCAVKDGVSTSKMMTTLNELMARSLNLMRLSLVAAPALVQCFYIHSVGLMSWLCRLLLVYMLMGSICFIAMPEQLYNGMGMGMFRWAFEIFYPETWHCFNRFGMCPWKSEIARSNGSLQESAEKDVVCVGKCRINRLGAKRAKLRWHGCDRYLCLTHDGWAVTGDEKHAAVVELHQVYWRDMLVPDTYTFRVIDATSDFHQHWLSFKPVNHLRYGGWLAAYEDEKRACPYKVVVDTSCPPDACKLLCAWTNMLPPSQRSCTGFYVTEQICGKQLFVGHGADRDSAILDLVFL
ncbi:unnamed protein product [Durusdinium trenchii]|uniref:Uncharacterized protein n=1 Tax=Durusdinium trenchii TaxID=1381693 RepID=A0ABP0SU53_9DINO